MDKEDLYEGGRFKRKRYDDDNSDDDSRKYHDPDAYDSNMAKMRSKLIRSEFDKRKSNSFQSVESNNHDLTDEEKILAKTTLVKDIYNNKIQNLSLKSRDNWLKKIQETLKENLKSFDLDADEDEVSDLLSNLEYEVFQKSKNLIVYQASSLKKINEVKKATKDKVSFLIEYKKTASEKESKTEEKISLEEEEKNDLGQRNLRFKPPRFDSTFANFTSALNVFKEEKKLIPEVEKSECEKSSLKVETKYENKKEEPPIEEKHFYKPEPMELDLIANTELIKISSPAIVRTVSSSKFVSEPLKSKVYDVEKKKEIKQENVKTLDLKQISVLVVTELTILYKGGKFLNKDIFKSLAKKLSHYILSKKIDTEDMVLSEIKSFVNKLSSKSKIQSESDYELYFL